MLNYSVHMYAVNKIKIECNSQQMWKKSEQITRLILRGMESIISFDSLKKNHEESKAFRKKLKNNFSKLDTLMFFPKPLSGLTTLELFIG